jgi:hypothetical protein
MSHWDSRGEEARLQALWPRCNNYSGRSHCMDFGGRRCQDLCGVYFGVRLALIQEMMGRCWTTKMWQQ